MKNLSFRSCFHCLRWPEAENKAAQVTGKYPGPMGLAVIGAAALFALFLPIDEVLPHLKYQPSNKIQDNQDIRNNRESRKDKTGKSPRGPLSDKNHPLRELSEIPGYIASAIISAEGEVVVADTPDGQVDPCLLGVLLVTVLEASSRVVVPTSLGSINFLLMDCDEGTLLARWIDDERKSLAAILLSSDGNLGLAKYKVNEALPALSGWLERHSRELTK
ncbi:MAG: hypothetical protein R6U68_09885 [Desulfobacteraceae bacterium]